MRRGLMLLPAILALAHACKSKDNTKIVVAVWSDLGVPNELDTVRVDVTGATGNRSGFFPLTAGSEPGKSKLPIQLELVPLAAKDATFTVKVVGLHAQSEIVSQTARVSFVSGQALLLKFFLARACESVPCTDNFTCSAGVCNQPIAVPGLPPYDPHQPLVGPDAGSGVDSGGVDSGANDSNTDMTSAEASAHDLRASDHGTIDTSTDGTPDIPLVTGGGGSGAGGAAGTGGTTGVGGAGGTTGAGGSGGAPNIDGNGIDMGPVSTTDAPLLGVGGAGGVAGGVAGSTGSGGISGTGGIVATGGTSGTTMEACVFGTSHFGSCKFGP